jgi:hypothetical protein
MADRTSFSDEDWLRVVASPMIAGMAVTAADPSGLWGLLQEGIAGGRALMGARQDASANPLVKAAVEDLTNAATREALRARVQAQFQGVPASEVKGKAVEELGHVSAILDRHGGADAAPFKAWVQGVAQRTAEAGKEGGFLGFGGVAVSDKEKATLAEIAVALGTPVGTVA